MKTKLLGRLSTVLMAIVAIAFLFSSCKETKELSQSDLDGYWVLKTLNGKDAKTLFAGALPTLEFNFTDSLVAGTGGCNRYTGKFTYEKGIFKAPNLAVTQMLCTEDNQEPEFLLALTNKESGLSLENGVLKFTYSGVVTLEFEKGTTQAKEEPAKPSAETLKGNWNLKTIDGVDAKTKFKYEVPSLTFDFAENRVYGNDGCNNYNAGFSLNDHTLILGGIISTRKACPDMESGYQFTQAISDTSIVTLPSEKILQVSKNGVILLELEKAVESDSTSVSK